MRPVYQAKRTTERKWEEIPAVTLTHMDWLEPCAVEAKAQLCYDDQALWIRLEAREQPVRATLTGPLDPVCTDSCLEFFFAPEEDDPRYFNFEFNPLGTLYLGYGRERATRVRQIVRDAEELFEPRPFFTEGGWGVVFRVPLEFLRLYFPDYTFSGRAACNFYKCGDRTDIPHYLAWAPLTSPTPDYHRRQDFGVLTFEA